MGQANITSDEKLLYKFLDDERLKCQRLREVNDRLTFELRKLRKENENLKLRFESICKEKEKSSKEVEKYQDKYRELNIHLNNQIMQLQDYIKYLEENSAMYTYQNTNYQLQMLRNRCDLNDFPFSHSISLYKG